MHRWRLHRRLAPTMLATCTLILIGALSLQAQESPTRDGGRGMGRMGGRPPMPDLVVLEGPPQPDSMAALVGLSGDGQARYTTMYENLMAATKPQRDSMAALREARMAARQGGGEGPRGRGGMQGMRALRDFLDGRQRQFDQALEDVLTRDQLKTYHDWRDQRRHEAEERMRERRRTEAGRGGSPPGT